MANPAFESLINLAAQSRRSAMGLPAQADMAPRWSGIGFSCMGFRFVVPMGQISELMEVPATTRLPGVHSWVIGLSNVRGRLLPLFDLARFIGGHVNSQKKSHRVLVWESDHLYSGLVVDKAFGMKHFIADTYSEESVELPDNLRGYVSGAYKDGSGESWSVFDMSSLAEDPNFINASAT